MAGRLASRLAKALGWTVAVLAALALAFAGVAVVVMTGQTGRDVVETLADGRELAGYGELQLSGLSGNPLDRLSVERLTVADAEGVWLEIEALTIDWRPRALIGRTLALESIEARRVRLIRRPQRAERPETQGGDGGGLPVSIALDALALQEIVLEPAFPGPEAVLSLSGEARFADGAGRASLSLDRLDAPGDRARIVLELDEAVRLDGVIEAAGDGPLAALLRTRGEPLEARVEASGDLAAGEGAARIDVAGRRAADLDLRWADATARVAGEARPGAWPGLDRLDALFGGPADIVLTAPLKRGRIVSPDLAAVSGRVESPALSVAASRAGSRALDLDIEAAAGLVNALAGPAVTVEALSGAGRVDFADGPLFDGRLDAAGFSAGPAAAARLSGPVRVEGPLARPVIEADLESQGFAWSGPAPDRLEEALGDAPALAGRMVFEREARVLRFERLALTAPSADSVTGEGAIRLDEGAIEARLAAENARLDRFAGAPPARADLALDLDGRFALPLRFDLDADLREIGAPWAERIGERLSLEAAGTLEDGGGVALERLQADGPALRLEADGRRDASGALTLSGEAAWSGAVPASAVSVAGALSAGFELAYAEDALDLRLDMAADALSAGPADLEAPRLRVEAEGAPSDLSGQWRLTASSPRGAVDLGSRFAYADGTASLTGLAGRAGPIRLSGEAELAGAQARVDLGLRPVNGFGEATLSGSAGAEGVDLVLAAEDLVREDGVYLDRLQLAAEGALEDVALRLEAAGAYGARFEAEAEGSARFAGGPFALSLDLDGRYGEAAIATREPIRLESRDAGLFASARLAAGDGRLDVMLEPGEPSPRLTAALDDAPAALLSYPGGGAPVEGVLSGRADLRFDPDGWTGEVSLQGDGLAPADAPEGSALAGGVTATLDAEGARIEARAAGAELDGRAELRLAAGPVTGFGALADPEVPVSGVLDASGDIGAFAAFHLPPGVRLTGDLDAEAEIDGRLGAPILEGRAGLSGAEVVAERAGVTVTGLEAEARFDRSSLRLVSFEAGDGAGGTLSAEGALDFAGGLSGDADIDFSDFRVLDRPELSAVGDGEIALALSERTLTVSGETRIDRAEVRPPEAGRAAIPTIRVTEINRPAGRREPAATEAAGDWRIVLDYDVVAPARIFVRGQQFDTEWALDVHAGGSVSDLELEGEARVLRGRASLLGRTFEIERGLVTLNGAPDDARLDIAAVREARDITARVLVTGPVTRPDIRLTSSPSLPEDEIAARLLFNEGAGSLTGLQAAQLAGAVASLSGGFDPFAALRSATGLDQLALGQSRTGETVITGGRYLADDVYLEFETTPGSAAPATRIEWSLTRGVTLVSRVTGAGEARVSLAWRREYD